MQKLIEHTDGTHIYMKLVLDNKRIEEIDVYLKADGNHTYITSADNVSELDTTEKYRASKKALRNDIIKAFNMLY